MRYYDYDNVDLLETIEQVCEEKDFLCLRGPEQATITRDLGREDSPSVQVCVTEREVRVGGAAVMIPHDATCLQAAQRVYRDVASRLGVSR